MTVDATRVVVTSGATANTTRVYHRDLPEIRSDGENPRAAASHLANELARAMDSALTDWRRGRISEALADVQAFVGEIPAQ
ncbi:MAG: hypothetical protein U0835_15725 [Isosphaeraceae bacterium]